MTDTMAALSEIERQIRNLHDLGERIQTAPLHSMRLALHTAHAAMKRCIEAEGLSPHARQQLRGAIRTAEAELGLEAA